MTDYFCNDGKEYEVELWGNKGKKYHLGDEVPHLVRKIAYYVVLETDRPGFFNIIFVFRHKINLFYNNLGLRSASDRYYDKYGKSFKAEGVKLPRETIVKR